MTGKSQGRKQKCEIIQIKVKAMKPPEKRVKIKEEIVLSSESYAHKYFELKEMKNTERGDRENIKRSENGQEILQRRLRHGLKSH